ncbi:MAG: hypothetical protein KA285_04215 [Bacteroidia bacterium]|nr:hypothetical protein [Bacteroidia bacterium]
MIRFFKSPQPASLIVIPAIILILWAQAFMNCFPVMEVSAQPVWKLFLIVFKSLPSGVNWVIMVALVSFSAIYINQISNKHEVLYKNSYLPAFVYALFISSVPEFLTVHPIHFVNLIILRVFDKSFSLIKNDSPVPSIFDSSFLAALAALIFFPAFIVIPVMIIALSLLRPFNFREWLIMFIGFSLPYFFVSVWMYWNHDLLYFWKDYLDRFIHLKPVINIVFTPQLITLSVLFGIWMLLGLGKLRVNYLKNVIRARIIQQVLFLFFIFSVGSIFLGQKISVVNFSLLAIPFSIFAAYYLLSAKKRIRFYEMFLWMVIAAIVWNHLA